MQGRAQTTLDFAIGISVFLIAVAFVFTFVPGILEPFEEGPQEETLVADRVASQLVGLTLADPAEPYLLEVPCTTEFFKQTPDTSLDCRFDQSVDLAGSGTLEGRLGLTDRQRVNVTVVGDDVDGDGDADFLCSDDGTVTVTADAASCGGTTLAVGGPTPESSTSVVVARRAVTIDGERATVVVRAW
ncbi:DUF7287 family protein [Natronomonas sp. EA1]|uniref:DUF7287 family protein n=1 Tax=Natronomonas sp. EA1 TaxID=3421655 RepID=UPI003EC14216